MGELARNFNWSNTPLGTPDHWPQNLRTSVSILLNSQFPMFVWWGDELITIYNDSYKIIAGDKHPGLLGKSGKEGWVEIWDDLAPLVAKVFSGVSTWSDDLLLYVNRHGFAEPAYFTFSYSPIFDDTGAVNGLFCAVVETTEKVVSKKKLEESREDLAFAIEAAELATWAYDPITNRFIADERYKEWFGLMGQEATYDTLSLNLIAEEDRQKVANAIVQAQDPSSDGRYEIQYTIRPKNKPERILRAKGKAWFTEEGVAYRLTGTLQDVTKQEESRKLVEESERNLRNTILQAPVAMCILKGRDNVIEIANERIIELWGVKGRDVIGKSIFAAIPELADQGFETLLSQVYTTGETYKAFGIPLTAADNEGGLHVIYIDFVYEAYRETDGSISGIIVVASDVTVQVSARKTVEESEQKVHALFQSAPFPIATYIGREMRIEMANPSLIEIWGKGPDIIGKLYAEVLPELDPEIYKQLEEVYTTGKAYHARNRRVDLVVDGKIKPYYFNYSFTPLFSTEGNVYGVMNTGADVTDLNVAKLQLEESEARFRTLVEQAPLPIAMTRGRDMVFEIINESMLHLIDRTDVLNKPIAEVLPELKEQLVENILYKVWDSGETFRGFEVPAKLNTGTQQRQSFFNILYSPVMENGIVSKIIHVAIDVTEQVLARKKIEESSAELQLAIEVAELGTFRVDLLHNEAVYSKRVMDWLNLT